MKLAPVLVASILSLTTLAARAAAPVTEALSVKVQFADLDLTREAGIARLYLRIKGAARQVCDQQAQHSLRQTYPACVKQAVSAAVARLDRPMLSDYVAQLGGEATNTVRATVAAR